MDNGKLSQGQGQPQIRQDDDHRGRLGIVLIMTLAYMGVEIGVGLWTNSLALLADSVHMFTDAGALVLAWFAAWFAQKPANQRRTYGYYRFEILAALANGMLLLVSAGVILFEAYRRFQTPGAVLGLPMLVVMDSVREQLTQLGATGIHLETVTQQLQDDGVQKFARSFAELKQAIQEKSALLKLQTA